MARDNKKNAAYDSGIRGKERAPQTAASSPSSRSKELRLPDGATRIEITPADNGFIVNCSYPPKDGKEWSWAPPKPKVFTSAADVAEFIESALKVDDEDKS